MPQCRICKQAIDKNKEAENIDWIMPSKNYYYHVKCYNDFRNIGTTVRSVKEEEEWKELIYDYLKHDLRIDYNYHKCEAQIKKFRNTNDFSMKGIYFALRYFYDIKKGKSDKAYDGIGIVQYVYKDSCEYWQTQERKRAGFMAELEKQIFERANREVKHIKPQKRKTNKPQYNLDEIGGEDE